ncbi:hypothetical protein HDV01_007409 [Terramyces sp. JEL0728]|nr:hypothetical protein HDV01_007409 [Terramyces sp. JEL0728]
MEKDQPEAENQSDTSLPPYSQYAKVWFVFKRFVVAPVDFTLSIAAVIDQYDSCTMYFIAASNSVVPTREVLFPMSIFAAGMCLMFRWMCFRNMFRKYKFLATEKGLVTMAETGPYFELMFDMKDKSPVGIFQKHITIVNLFGQHFIQIFIAYYVIYISQIDFTWLSSFRVFLSTIISCYTFAQLFTLHVKRYSRAMHIIVFVVFVILSFVLAFIIPRIFVVYPNEIDVSQLQIVTQNQVCYSTNSTEILPLNCVSAQSCSFPLDFAVYSKSQILKAPAAVSNSFYYSTIPPTSGQNTTKLVFQSLSQSFQLFDFIGYNKSKPKYSNQLAKVG